MVSFDDEGGDDGGQVDTVVDEEELPVLLDVVVIDGYIDCNNNSMEEEDLHN